MSPRTHGLASALLWLCCLVHPGCTPDTSELRQVPVAGGRRAASTRPIASASLKTDDPVERHEAVRRRARATFDQARYYKPEAAEGPQSYLLPLIVVESASDGSERGPRLDGHAGASTRPVLYRDTSTAILRDRAFEQVSYLWALASPPGKRAAHWQGVRLTLDDRGFAVFYEVLDRRAPDAVVFASRALNEAVARRIGPPLPDRYFAIERAMAEQPGVVVANITDPGPQPMGPMVYIDLAGRITAVVCRCGPSQFSEAVETTEYEIRSIDDPRLGAERPAWSGLLAPLPEMADPSWLEKALRLTEMP